MRDDDDATRDAMRDAMDGGDGATTRDDGEHQEHGEGEREGCVEATRIDGEATRDREGEARRRRAKREGSIRDDAEKWIGRIGDGDAGGRWGGSRGFRRWEGRTRGRGWGGDDARARRLTKSAPIGARGFARSVSQTRGVAVVDPDGHSFQGSHG